MGAVRWLRAIQKKLEEYYNAEDVGHERDCVGHIGSYVSQALREEPTTPPEKMTTQEWADSYAAYLDREFGAHFRAYDVDEIPSLIRLCMISVRNWTDEMGFIKRGGLSFSASDQWYKEAAEREGDSDISAGAPTEPSRKVYMCGVAWRHELGETDVQTHGSPKYLYENHRGCGIVECEVTLTGWIEPEDHEETARSAVPVGELNKHQLIEARKRKLELEAFIARLEKEEASST